MGGTLDYSTTAGSNTTVGGVNIAEGMQAGLMNNALRAAMADSKKWQLDWSGIVTAGTSNAYTITSNQGIAAYADGLRLCFRADRNNTGAATLNVDSRGAKALRKVTGGALAAVAADDIVAEAVYDVVYDLSSDVFVIVGTSGFSSEDALDLIQTYGLGETGNTDLLADIDLTTIASGAYRFNTSSVGTFPTGVVASDDGIIVTWRRTSASAMMLLYHASSDRIFHRSMTASAWGTWRESITVDQGATEGDTIYRGASAWTRLAKGTAGQHLRMNSGATAPEWTSENTALASWTYSSNVTSIPLTGLSGWDSVVVTGFLTISANVQLRVSADNGSTWRSTNYVWRVLDEGGGTDPTDGMDLCRIGSGSIQFDITLQRMSQASRATYASGNARHGNPRMNTFAGIHNVSEVINAIQIVGATISAGYVDVYGIRRA